MASHLLQSNPNPLVSRYGPGVERFGKQRMRKDSIVRFSAIVLALLTATTIVFAIINWQKEGQYTTPTDGVWWKEQAGFLVAKGLIPNGPGEKAGIKVGDRLLRVNNLPQDQTIKNIVEFEKHLYRSGVYSRATYLLARQGVNVEVGPVIPVPADNSLKLGAAAHRADLSGHWFVRSLSPLDGPKIHAFLSLLPGFICTLLVSLHRQAERV